MRFDRLMYGCEAVDNALIDRCRDVKLTVDAIVLVMGMAAISGLCIYTMRMVVSCVDVKVDSDGIIVLRSMRDTHRVAVDFEGLNEQERHRKKQQTHLTRRH